MNYLLDTQLLVWSLTQSPRLSPSVRELLEEPENQPYASVISIWEVAIRYSLQRPDFTIDAHNLRRAIRETDFRELPIVSDHALAIQALPNIHKDPFDRLLIAQAIVEGMTLLTVDSVLAKYPGPVRLV
jgi:PIN domain nuclease of toxin-antitoxin system